MEGSTDLAVKNVELGKVLLEQAHKKYNEDRQAAVVGEVGRLLAARDEYRQREDFAHRAVDWYDAKLKAIHAGEFQIGTVAGVTGVGGVTFNNPDFNRANF